MTTKETSRCSAHVGADPTDQLKAFFKRLEAGQHPNFLEVMAALAAVSSQDNDTAPPEERECRFRC